MFVENARRDQGYLVSQLKINVIGYLSSFYWYVQINLYDNWTYN
jgi:hypothetical protein